MKLHYTVIGLLFLFFYSCSFITNFYIYNDTAVPIIVEYKITESSDYNPFIINPEVVRFNWRMRVKKVSDQSSLSIDKNSNVVKCTLQPNQALMVGGERNYTDNDFDRRMLVKNLDYLVIKGGKKKLEVNKENVVELFERLKYHTYIIRVE